MKNPLINYVGWLLLFTILAAYLFCVSYSFFLYFTQKNVSFPEPLSSTLSSIQAILITNLGALLGITVAKPNSQVARSMMFNRPAPPPAAAALPPVEDPLVVREKIQLVALLIFVLVLITSFVIWMISFSMPENKKHLEFISESGRMFVGVAIAYITGILAAQKTNP